MTPDQQVDLRAANAEVRSLMDRVLPAEKEIEELRRHVRALEWQIEIVRAALAMTLITR